MRKVDIWVWTEPPFKSTYIAVQVCSNLPGCSGSPTKELVRRSKMDCTGRKSKKLRPYLQQVWDPWGGARLNSGCVGGGVDKAESVNKSRSRWNCLMQWIVQDNPNWTSWRHTTFNLISEGRKAGWPMCTLLSDPCCCWSLCTFPFSPDQTRWLGRISANQPRVRRPVWIFCWLTLLPLFSFNVPPVHFRWSW